MGCVSSRLIKSFSVPSFPFHDAHPREAPAAARLPAPSTADGHFVAFGGTEEDLVKTVLGLQQRGLPTEPALDRATGVGYVAPHKGDYADALSKRFTVVLFNMETSGAVG